MRVKASCQARARRRFLRRCPMRILPWDCPTFPQVGRLYPPWYNHRCSASPYPITPVSVHSCIQPTYTSWALCAEDTASSKTDGVPCPLSPSSLHVERLHVGWQHNSVSYDCSQGLQRTALTVIMPTPVSSLRAGCPSSPFYPENLRPDLAHRRVQGTFAYCKCCLGDISGVSGSYTQTN